MTLYVPRLPFAEVLVLLPIRLQAELKISIHVRQNSNLVIALYTEIKILAVVLSRQKWLLWCPFDTICDR